MNDCTFDDLTEFRQDLLKAIDEQFPKESKKHMQSMANALTRRVRSAYKRTFKTRTGNLLKGTKRGRTYYYNGNQLQIRIHSAAPHASLLEYGHRIFNSDKEVEGSFIMQSAEASFYPYYQKKTEEFIDRMLEEGLS